MFFRKLFFITVFLAAFFFRLFSTKPLDIPGGKVVTIRFNITEQPYLNNNYQVINTSNFSIKTAKIPGYFYGQRIEVTGRFEKRVINKFFAKYVCNFPKIVVIENAKNDSIFGFFVNLRKLIEDKIRGYLPVGNFALLMGVTFGQKAELPKQLLQNLRETGTTHIVVASGQNLTLLTGFVLEALLLLIKRRQAVLICLLVIIGYILLTGAQPPILRAGIMVGVVLLATYFGREAKAGQALFVAAGLILLSDPLILFDVGFQLSFASTAGIIWIYPVLVRMIAGDMKVIRKVGSARAIEGIKKGLEILLVSLAAQMAIFPITMANFSQASLLSPIINCLVLWLVAPIMIFGFGLTLFSFVIPPVAVVLSWFCWLLTETFIQIINFFGSRPLLVIKIDHFPVLAVLVYYALLITAVFISKERLGEINNG